MSPTLVDQQMQFQKNVVGDEMPMFDFIRYQVISIYCSTTYTKQLCLTSCLEETKYRLFITILDVE